MPDPPSAPRLAARVEAAEAAFQHAALGRPDALALLETAVARLAEALQASVGAAFVAAGETGYVRCAVCADAALPDLLDLDPAPWGDVLAGHVVAVRPGTREADALLAGLGTTHALLLPIRGAAPGVVALGRSAAFSHAERAAGARLAALFSTLWAWTDAEARFHRIVADLDDALFTFGHDAQGRRTYAVVTPQAETITGLVPDAILAGTVDWAAHVHADDRAAFAAHDARLRAGEASRISVRLVRPGGEIVWISERATPSVDAAGRPVAGGLLSDVTAQKEAEATLDRARRTAERASEARMAFLRLMSHELRTPLGAIRGFAELLADEVAEMRDAPSVVTEFTATIGEASARALRLVSDLLDLARLETGALDLVLLPVDVAPLVRAAAARVAPDLARRGIALCVAADGETVARADAARLEQVVGQLVANAAAFTQAGRVDVQIASAGGVVSVRVADTGAGIDETFLESLFEPFAQEDTRVNRDREGSGLGLAIARRLVEAMGGRLSVESVHGEGSAFTVTLPAAAE
ncbi:MAG TPA: PAS domain-containing sensor histidine kinase [Rubricoccaceae bacterium]